MSLPEEVDSMDRVNQLTNGFIIFAFLLAPAISADMVFAPPPTRPDPMQAGERFPESRFGQPPARVDLGVTPRYAAQAVEEFEGSDEAVGAWTSSAPNRRIAGLEITSGVPAERAVAQPAPGTRNTDLRPDLSPKNVDPTSAASAIVRKGVQEVAVIAGDLGFFPKTVFVTRDVPVRLFVTGASKNTLCIMMDSFQVRKQVRSQKIEEITFTPNMPGKYRFYCPVNGSEGTLVVKEFANRVSENAATGE